VRLHVGKLRIEDLLRPVARKIFDHVGVLASTVVAPARISLGVLVCEDRTRRLQNRFRNKVFARDHLQPFMLAECLVVNGGCNFRIGLG